MNTLNFKLLTSFFLLLFFCSCSENNNIKIEYYKNGNPKSINIFTYGPNNKKEILFNTIGHITKITNYIDSFKEGEQLNFHELNGVLKSKFLFKGNLANGVGYEFYQSGALKSSRHYINDKKWYLGFDYWNDSFVINKTLFRFNKNGDVYYKLNFDSAGNPTTSEGKEFQ